MGVEAPVVTDGVLIPWKVDETCGTIWIMAHERAEAFDGYDARMMELLADFAAMAVAEPATGSAHQPGKDRLRSQHGKSACPRPQQPAAKPDEPRISRWQESRRRRYQILAEEMSADLERLSELVKKLLALPGRAFAN